VAGLSSVTSTTFVGALTGAATTAGTVTTAAQPNITSVGTLSSLSVTGNVTGGNLVTAGLISATGNITGGNISVLNNITVSSLSATGNINSGGTISAVSKSFLIDHPTKEGKKLRHGSLEGPENGVYVRGKLKDTNAIELPDYWTKLVDPDSITVTLTPIGAHQKLYVKDVSNNTVTVGNGNLLDKTINCYYVVYAERCDVEKLEVEIDVS
jgi:hypothetical protein